VRQDSKWTESSTSSASDSVAANARSADRHAVDPSETWHDISVTRRPNPFIVASPTRRVGPEWDGPIPWVLTTWHGVEEWHDGVWRERDLGEGELVGYALLRGTACADRGYCDVSFVPGDAGGMIICDDCGHAAEVVEDDHNNS